MITDFPFQSVHFNGSSLNLARTTHSTIKALFDHLGALDPNQEKPKFLDLGCGDGRLVVEAATRGYDATGVDLEHIDTLSEDVINTNLGCKFIQTDMFEFDIAGFDVITCYIYQRQLQSIRDKLATFLEGDGVVVTLLYQPIGWTPIFVDELMRIYFYDKTSV